MSSSPSTTSTASASSFSSRPRPGLLWVTCHIQSKPPTTPPLTLSLFHSWYTEHLTDVLSTPGAANLALRYENLSPKIDIYSDPDFSSRINAPKFTIEAVEKFGWKHVALVKLRDVMWLTSREFEGIPRTSDQLPRREDGSVGSAFDCWHAGLRSYETVETSATSSSLGSRSSGDGSATLGGEGRRKWLVSVQTVSGEDEILEAVVDAYGREKGCRYWIMYRLVTGLLGYFEPSEPDLPRGMVLLQFDGEEPPRVQAKVQGLRTDVWSLVTERGDMSLEL